MKLYKYILSVLVIIGLNISCDTITSLLNIDNTHSTDTTSLDIINYEYKYDSLLVENEKLINKVDSLENVKHKVIFKTKTVVELKEDTIVYRDTIKINSIERKDSIIYITKVTEDKIKPIVFRTQYTVNYDKNKLIKFKLKPKYYVNRDILRIYNWEGTELHEIGFFSKDDFMTKNIKLKGYLFVVEGVSPNYDIDKRLKKMIKF
jgi:hypothetical protein